MKGGRTVTLVLVLSALAAYERAGGEFAISMFVNVCNCRNCYRQNKGRAPKEKRAK